MASIKLSESLCVCVCHTHSLTACAWSWLCVEYLAIYNWLVCVCLSEEKVEMTAPVTCLVDPGAGPACETTFTVSFYIPEEHQADPPLPSDPEVFLENRKEFTVFVR